MSQANYSATNVLELVHDDLCGPISPRTAAGKRYFFLLVDDYSRIMWVYFLKSNEALNAFKKFCALVETGPEKKVMVFRTNMCGVFISNDFKSYCEEAGIIRHYTTPYTAQRNGIVKRRNRMIVKLAKSCLKKIQLSSFLGGSSQALGVSTEQTPNSSIFYNNAI